MLYLLYEEITATNVTSAASAGLLKIKHFFEGERRNYVLYIIHIYIVYINILNMYYIYYT